MQEIFNRLKNRFKRFLLDLRKKLNVIYELDYPRHKIYLYDNVRVPSCHKEPDTVRWIEGFDKGDTVFDIGANVGTFSLIMSLYSDQVYAIEPAFMNFELLCRNIALNVKRSRISNNICPLNIALGKETALEVLNYTTFKLGNSGHQINGGKVFDPFFKQGILCFSIDSLINQFSIPSPNHIKLDVDGIEFEILKGGDRTLSNKNLKSVLVETQNENEREMIAKYFQEKNLFLTGKYNTDPTQRQTDNPYNCIFTRK